MKNKVVTTIKQRRDINIGIVVFFFVLLYLALYIYRYFTRSELAIYEVPVGTIYSTESFKGLIIREEQIINTESAGFVNYYYSEGDRISKNETIYSIDSENSIYQKFNMSSTDIKLSDDDIASLKKTIIKKYNKIENYSDYEKLKDELLATYRRDMDKIILQNLNEKLAVQGGNSDARIVKSKTAGIISYYIDDYSGITEDSIRTDMYDTHTDMNYIYTSDMLNVSQPVYKMITDDDWKIVIHINSEIFNRIYNKEYITFTINSRQTITAPAEVKVINDDYFLVVSLTKYITNYTKYRFLDISFDTEAAEGLKIPETAVCYKDFYRIPRSYLSYQLEENTDTASSEGLLTESYDPNSGAVTVSFYGVDIFFSDKDYIYIDSATFDPNVYITNSDRSSRSMLYLFNTKLEGVYNVNNGYSEFRRIETILKEQNYRLVKKNSVSGLAVYDHIALNSSDIVEGTVIIR